MGAGAGLSISHLTKDYGRNRVLSDVSCDVEPGEVVPGVGRVIAIKERAGRWIVVTESGEIIGNAHGQSHAPPPRQRQFARELNGFMPRPFPPPPMFPPY